MEFMIALILFTYYGIICASESIQDRIAKRKKEELHRKFDSIKLSEEEDKKLSKMIEDSGPDGLTGLVARVRDFVWYTFDLRYSPVFSNSVSAKNCIKLIESCKIGKVPQCTRFRVPELKNIASFHISKNNRIKFMKYIQDNLIESSGKDVKIAYDTRCDYFVLTYSDLYTEKNSVFIDDPKIYDVVKGESEEEAKTQNDSMRRSFRIIHNCMIYGEKAVRRRLERGLDLLI